MAKQIIVTQNDYGIELEAQFVDDKKRPISTNGYDVKANIIYDNKVIDTIIATCKNEDETISYIILEKEHLKNVGLHTVVWSVVDEDEHITAQEDLYYFVKETKVTSDNDVDNEDDDDDIIIETDKVTIILNKLDEVTEEIKDIKTFNINASNEINDLKQYDLELKADIPNIKNSLTENNKDIELLKNKTEENRTTLSSLSNSVTQNYQTKTSDKLKTTSKDVVGAINEIKDFVSVDNTLNENGYYKLPNGLIMQWGTSVLSNSAYDAEIRITMPKSVQKILSPMVTLSDMTGRVTYTTYNLDTTGFLIKMRSVAPVVGTGVGIGAIRIYWFALCK